MRRLSLILIFIACCSVVLQVSQADGAYSRSTDFGPVSLTYGELNNILKKARSNIDSANASTKSQTSSEDERLTIEGRGQSLDLTGPVFSFETSRAPEIGYTVFYRYHLSNSPISSVEIWLRDYDRTLKVTGTSPDQVDALFALLASELSDKTTTAGGSSFRLIVFIGLMLLGSISLSAGPGVSMLRRRTGFLLIGLGMLFEFSAFSGVFLPVDTWLPGTSVYSGDKFFIVRHAALFSFLGSQLALVPIFLSLLSGSKKASEVKESSVESIAETTEERSQTDVASHDESLKGS